MQPTSRVPKSSAAAPQARRRTLPLSARKQQVRRQAAARAVARTTVALTSAQRHHDPLARVPRTAAGRSIKVLAPALGSLLVHAAIVAIGFASGAFERGRAEKVEQKITIEMREPPPLPPAPAQAENPTPEPPRPAKAPIVKRPAPTPAEPPAKAPPPRVIGLSLESTSQSGDGPAFAVGNSREGRTEEKAADPTAVPKDAPPPPGQNQVATRLPGAGVRYVQPRRRAERKPIFPPLLRAQGIEADVKVSLAIDATGKVTAVRVLNPSPYPEFDAAAKATAFKEEFDPASRDGTPIPYSISFTYRFRLEDQ